MNGTGNGNTNGNGDRFWKNVGRWSVGFTLMLASVGAIWAAAEDRAGFRARIVANEQLDERRAQFNDQRAKQHEEWIVQLTARAEKMENALDRILTAVGEIRVANGKIETSVHNLERELAEWRREARRGGP